MVQPLIQPPQMDVPTCCAPRPAPTTAVSTRFHFALNCSNLARSVDFYSRLFDVPPAKHYPDYAKFELAQPPLVFSLVPNAPGSQGSLSHLGFPVPSREAVEAAGARLAAAGLEISRQDGTVCGYARQDKIWVADPDQNFWEIYVVHEDVDPATVRRSFDGVSPEPVPEIPTPTLYEHRVTDGPVHRLDFPDHAVDEVRLTGTFNAALDPSERRELLREVHRVLKDGGSVLVHGLVASTVVGTVPALPGVAGLVRRIPQEAEPQQELAAAGFEGLAITKLTSAPVFQVGAVEFRELKVRGTKPVSRTAASELRMVVYKGPLASLTDDQGTVFERGRRVTIPAEQESRLARSTIANHFLFVRSEQACGTGCLTEGSEHHACQ